MPYSSTAGKAFITRLVHNYNLRYRVENILDIGIGSGTYSNLFRNKFRTKDSWTGIEVWEPYVEMFDLKSKYDRLIIEDARTVFGETLVYEHHSHLFYDIAFVGDVLEHMTLEEAQILFAQTLACSKILIISIPLGHYPQEEYLGNPYEKHVKDDWSHDAVVTAFGIPATYAIDNEIGVYVYRSPFDDSIDDDFIRRCGHGPIVVAYGIFQNEEKHIDRLFNNLIAADIDHLFFCDTGSTDNTNELVKKHIDESFNVTVNNITVKPWRFDQARNTALSLVSPHVDVCISIDADEMLEPTFIEKLRYEGMRQAPFRWDHRFETQWRSGYKSEHYHERIHSRVGYMWKLPVHEILEPYNGQEFRTFFDGLMIQIPDEDKPRTSYFEMLKQSVIERDNVWKSWSFLASEYAMRGLNQEATECIDKALQLSDADTAYLHYQKGCILEASGNRQGGIAELIVASSKVSIRELYVYLAEMCKRDNNHQMAYAMLSLGMRIVYKTSGYLYNSAVWDDEKMQAQLAEYKQAI